MDYLPPREIMILITIAVLFTAIILELFKPARTYTKQTKKLSYITNSFIFIFNNIFSFFLQVSIVFLFISENTHNLFYTLNTLLSIFVGFIILDVSIYIWHRLNHASSFLWSFHKCHHSETYLNATSAVRFHIVELLLSVIFKSFILLITGIPFAIFMAYEACITIFAIFHHANFALPQKAQYIASKVLITPTLHRVHHSDKRAEHDTNFGVIFIWWDKIFGTLHNTIPEKIGLSYGGEKSFVSFLTFPFKK